MGRDSGLGDLGGGNHFLDALLPYDEDTLYFLIHTRSRNESGIVDDLAENPAQFDRKFSDVVSWAESNRAHIQDILGGIIGPLELILDLPHNTYEKLDDCTIIRKGAVRLKPGELSILPSHISADALLIRATPRIEEILLSMSHGTGRAISRGDAKPLADKFDFGALR